MTKRKPTYEQAVALERGRAVMRANRRKRLADSKTPASAPAVQPPRGYEVWVVADPRGDGYTFETPDGDGYGAPTSDEACDLARSMGFDPKVYRS